MHYYKFNIADWALHTAHLTPEEEGIYFRLINYYYDTEQPIEQSKTQSVCRRLRVGSQMDQVGLILEEFFSLVDGFWVHKRCELEISDYKAMAEKNRVNGSRGGRPKGSKDSQKRKGKEPITQWDNSGNPNITLTTNHKPITNNQLTQESQPPESPPKKQVKAKQNKTSLPADFSISNRVRIWAKEKGHNNLETHFENFIGASTAKGYKYVDWDAAFMNAIRNDWAKVNGTKPQNVVNLKKENIRDYL